MTRIAATLALAVMCAPSTSAVLDAQGSGGVQVHVQVNVPAQPAAPVGTVTPSLNRPSFPLTDLNRPSFPLSGPPGIGLEVPSPFAARPETFTRLHRPGFAPLFFPAGFDLGFGVPFYGSSYAASTYDKLYRRPQPAITTGTLFLDVTPATALVFVDTAYVGSVGDLQARGVTLSASRHYVDLEAPGYESKTIAVVITAGEPLRYRYDMTPTRRADAVVIPPKPPETMYAIPGCYGGNKPPLAGNLPKGCDIAKVRVLRPQPRTN